MACRPLVSNGGTRSSRGISDDEKSSSTRFGNRAGSSHGYVICASSLGCSGFEAGPVRSSSGSHILAVLNSALMMLQLGPQPTSSPCWSEPSPPVAEKRMKGEA